MFPLIELLSIFFCVFIKMDLKLWAKTICTLKGNLRGKGTLLVPNVEQLRAFCSAVSSTEKRRYGLWCSPATIQGVGSELQIISYLLTVARTHPLNKLFQLPKTLFIRIFFLFIQLSVLIVHARYWL